MRVGYTSSCGSRKCSIEASKKTRLKKYGDENYNNRKQFKATIKNRNDEDPDRVKRIIAKQKNTIAKHIEKDPNYYEKRLQKTRATKLKKYGNEKYNGHEKYEETMMRQYGVKNGFQSETIKQKIRQSLMEHLGVEHAMQSQICKDKRVQTYRRDYGVDNPSQLKENRDLAKRTTAERHGDPNYRNTKQQKETVARKTKEEKQAIKQKREAYNLDHYGVKWPIALHNHRSSISKLSIRVKQLLEQHSVTFEMEFKIYYQIGSDIHIRKYDFKIGQIILELNGDFFHANPSSYKSGSIIRIHHQDVKVDDIWIDDLKKKELAETNGYTVIYLWQSDMKKMNDEQLFQWIYNNCIKNY